MEELLSRSFFDVVREYCPLLIFKMHDLIHDLAISVAQTESCNITKERTQDISPSTRHISFFNTFDVPKDELRGCLSKLSRVRTVMFGKLGSSEEFLLETCIGRFKHLRVLLLRQSTFDLLPSSIGNLKYLRNLQLYDCRNLRKLPNSVCKLRNLQCLDLDRCRELDELPADIKNMINLRLLGITTKQQRFSASGIGCSTSLRWLYIGECENLETLFDDIQSLTSLRLLAITSCPKLASLPQGIKNLPALEHLWTVDCERLRLPEGESNEPRSTSRLQSFRFEVLHELVSLPRWLESSASTLQRIRIADCPNLRVLPEWLQDCSSLKKLEILNCRRLSSRILSSLPEGIRGIATIHNDFSSSDEEEGPISCVENSD